MWEIQNPRFKTGVRLSTLTVKLLCLAFSWPPYPIAVRQGRRQLFVKELEADKRIWSVTHTYLILNTLMVTYLH